MRIAALYDIHGNLPALEAVLKDVAALGVDRVVVGGDVIPGPMPRETLAKVLRVGVKTEFIRGNGEVAVLEQLDGRVPALPDPVRPIIEWTAHQFGPGEAQLLRAWNLTTVIDSGRLGQMLFCHATPRNENEIFTRLTPDIRLEAIFEAVDADVVVCGHTHMQFDRTLHKLRIVNAGSIGMPFGPPGAYWLLIDEQIELRFTPYDLDEAAARIRGSSYPHAEQFADKNVLNPPTEEQMLGVYSKVDLN